MTKQLNNIWVRVLVGITVFLEVALLIASYAFRHFTSKRLGMLRHVVERNKYFEKEYPTPTLQIVLAAFGLIMLLGILLYLLKKKSKSISNAADSTIGCLLILGYFYLILRFNASTLRDYYYQLLVWSLLILAHAVRLAILIFSKKINTK